MFAGLAVALVALVACSDAKRAAQSTFTPRTPGQLVVATDLPAPGFWDGDDPATVHGGFEWAIAGALAGELGLTLSVHQVAFGAIVDGDLGDADLALAQASVTDARLEHVDFSVAYDSTSPAVLTRSDADDLTDLATAKDKQWVVQSSTTELDYLSTVVVPDRAPMVVGTEDAVVDAVRSGRADAALLDIASALAIANLDPGLRVASRFDHEEQVAAVLPKGSSGTAAVDRALRELIANGTIEQLRAEYLRPTESVDPESVPVIRARR